MEKKVGCIIIWIWIWSSSTGLSGTITLEDADKPKDAYLHILTD